MPLWRHLWLARVYFNVRKNYYTPWSWKEAIKRRKQKIKCEWEWEWKIKKKKKVKDSNIKEWIEEPKEVNTLKKIKDAEIKYKRLIPGQKELLNLFNNLSDIILTDKTLMSSKDENEKLKEEKEKLKEEKEKEKLKEENENENENEN